MVRMATICVTTQGPGTGGYAGTPGGENRPISASGHQEQDVGRADGAACLGKGQTRRTGGDRPQAGRFGFRVGKNGASGQSGKDFLRNGERHQNIRAVHFKRHIVESNGAQRLDFLGIPLMRFADGFVQRGRIQFMGFRH